MRIRLLISLAALWLLPGCEKALQLRSTGATPEAVFNQVWKEMDEHYALFEVKGIDWDSVYQQFHPRVQADLSNNSLFGLLNEMLQTLHDGHVALYNATDTAVYVDFYTPYPINFSLDNIVNHYLENDYKTAGPLIYKTVQNTGYIYYASFSENLSAVALDSVFGAMSGVKGLILDLRNNSGGGSGNANMFFSRLISDLTTVKYEKVKNGPAHDAFDPPVPLVVKPAGNFFSRPIIVLTNRLCFSACNDFVSYLKNLGNVIQVGDQTGGGGGIPQSFLLSNGWTLQYTATETLDANRQSIENGITPDVYKEISSAEMSSGKDPILDYAFASLQ